MGIHALSDAEKKRRGTFKPEKSEEARARKAVDNVMAFPVLDEVPRCRWPLKPNGLGLQSYTSWCRRLINAGLLTDVSLGYVEQFAIAEDKIEKRLDGGLDVPDKAMEVRRSALMKLEALNVDTSLVPNQAQKGAFGKNGFAGRLRDPADHRARRSG